MSDLFKRIRSNTWYAPNLKRDRRITLEESFDAIIRLLDLGGDTQAVKYSIRTKQSRRLW